MSLSTKRIIDKYTTLLIPRFRVCYKVIQTAHGRPFILVFLPASTSPNIVDFPPFQYGEDTHIPEKCMVYLGTAYQVEDLSVYKEEDLYVGKENDISVEKMSNEYWVSITEIINQRHYLDYKVAAQVVHLVVYLKLHLLQNVANGSIYPCPDIGYHIPEMAKHLVKQDGVAGLGYYFKTSKPNTASIRFALFTTPNEVYYAQEGILADEGIPYLLPNGDIVLRDKSQFMALNVC
jgi:hypothetical protein